MRTLFLVLIPALLLTGCFSASTTPEPVTATPEIMPHLDPSPTFSGSALPLTCQVTDLNVYVNEPDGYCFAYPARLKAGHQPMLNVPAIVGPALEDVDPVFAAFAWRSHPPRIGPCASMRRLS